jgi:hypothetical protein
LKNGDFPLSKAAQRPAARRLSEGHQKSAFDYPPNYLKTLLYGHFPVARFHAEKRWILTSQIDTGDDRFVFISGYQVIHMLCYGLG